MSTNGRVKEIIRDFCGANHVDATDALAAASVIDEEFIIIPRSELPEFKVIERNGKQHVDCGSDWGTWDVAHVNRMRTTALEYVGAWLTAEKWHAEREEAKAQADAAARQTRRDELARELVQDGAYSYRFAEEPLKIAIDRIIELERKAS